MMCQHIEQLHHSIDDLDWILGVWFGHSDEARRRGIDYRADLTAPMAFRLVK
jgi:hypothetical protein